MAGCARRGQVLPCASTTRAGAREHDEAALRRDLARAPALAAGLGLAALRRAGPLARLAGCGAADGDLVLAPQQCVFQRDDGFDAYVLTALRAAFAPCAAALARPPKPAEKVGEHVLEVTQDVAHAGAADIKARAA